MATQLPKLQPLVLQGLPYEVQEWFRQIQLLVTTAGGGTVTAVSVTSNAGVSGTVATPTTTPAISLTLGAITPTSVAASGTVTGSNLSGTSSGTNTGDQAYNWASFTPARTGWTDVGAPTVTGRYVTISHVTYFQIKVIPATTTATVGGTSYVDLPIAANASSFGGDGSMMNITTLLGVGNCVIDSANSRCYVPTQGATGNILTIGGWYEN